MRLSLLLVLLLCSFATLGQVPGSAPSNPTIALTKALGAGAQLHWIAPTTFQDNTPIGGAALSYNIYSAAPGAPWQSAASALTALTWTSAPLAKGNLCFAVTAVVAGLESGPSNIVCIATGVPPNPPGAVTVE